MATLLRESSSMRMPFGVLNIGNIVFEVGVTIGVVGPAGVSSVMRAPL